MSAYLLCASPRSGSTLLCDLLWQTGVAGRPHSFFRPGSIGDWADWFGLPPMDAQTFDQAYVDAAIKRGTQGTGTFGQRIMWDSMPGLLTRLRALQENGADVAVLERAFGPCRFVHLSRVDKVAQAVSLAIAEQTGLWHRNADGTDRENFQLAEVATYDDAQITKELEGLETEATGWSGWFAANELQPHRLTYEALVADPQGEVAKILTFLGLDATLASTLSPGTQKLGTAMNHSWATRYRTEHGLPSPSRQA